MRHDTPQNGRSFERVGDEAIYLERISGEGIKRVMEEVVVTAMKMLRAKRYIKLENYFVDGTKIESASLLFRGGPCLFYGKK